GRLAGTFTQGCACAMMLACRLSSVVFIAPFAVWVFIRSPARAVAFVIFACLAFVPWAVLHASLYGTVLGPSTGQLLADNWSGPNIDSLAAILVSPGRGLLVYQPWIVLAVLSLFSSLCGSDRVTCPSGWAWFCVCVILLHLALIGSWKCWWGGYCW